MTIMMTNYLFKSYLKVSKEEGSLAVIPTNNVIVISRDRLNKISKCLINNT